VEVAERRFHVSATSLEALSASNDVAETWKRLSASSTSAPHSPNIPLRSAANPIHQEAREVPKCVKVHQCTATTTPINHLWRAPAAMRWYGTDRGGQGTPSTPKTFSKTSKTTSASPGSASALPGDVAGDRVRSGARSPTRPPPGSP
jgi:hypothetical protein